MLFQDRDRPIEREQDDSHGGVGLEGTGIKQKGGRSHGRGQQCGDCRRGYKGAQWQWKK